LLSAQHSNEDNYAALELARQLGVTKVFVTGRAAGQGDNVLRHADKNPNTAGVTALANGFLAGSARPEPLPALAAAVERGAVTHLLALGSDIAQIESVPALKRLQGMVLLGTWEGPLARVAHIVLPASSWAECDGHFTNAAGITQESLQAIPPQGDSRPAWKLLAALALRLGYGQALPWRTIDEVVAAMSPKPAPSLKPRSVQPGVVQ
jgi:NADH dehydrogenase/NADH:ubiquinone oxidoreductase subunit G